MEKIVPHGAVDLSISVVSHLQAVLIAALFSDIETHCKTSNLELILTLNVEEDLPFDTAGFSWPVKVIRNVEPKGFGANHNQAFKSATGRYFCVMNPDIRLSNDPFDELVDCLRDTTVAVAAPLVLDGQGEIDDTARRFPTPLGIMRKAFGKHTRADYNITSVPVFPDWVGGMFMLFPRAAFERTGGFDERYFLYYEDVDICARVWLQGRRVALCPSAKVYHHARRSSHRSLKYARWHAASMIRFFLSPVYWRLRARASARVRS